MAVLNPSVSAKRNSLKELGLGLGGMQNIIKKVRKIKSPTFLQVSWDPMLGFDINIRDSLKQNLAFNKRGDKG